MPQWPHDTLEKLRNAGYSYQERGKCSAPTCRVEVFWFITPKGKWMPMEALAPAGEPGSIVPRPTAATDDALGAGSQAEELRNSLLHFQPHFASCPESRRFSRRGEPGKTTTVERT